LVTCLGEPVRAATGKTAPTARDRAGTKVLPFADAVRNRERAGHAAVRGRARTQPPTHATVEPAHRPVGAGPRDSRTHPDFLKAVEPPLKVEEIRLPRGGHNTTVWLGALPAVLTWIGTHLHT